MERLWEVDDGDNDNVFILIIIIIVTEVSLTFSWIVSCANHLRKSQITVKYRYNKCEYALNTQYFIYICLRMR